MVVTSGAEPLASAPRDLVLLVTDNRRGVVEAACDGCGDAALPVANVVFLSHVVCPSNHSNTAAREKLSGFGRKSLVITPRLGSQISKPDCITYRWVTNSAAENSSRSNARDCDLTIQRSGCQPPSSSPPSLRGNSEDCQTPN